MKKIYGFAFASALLALASCSNDSEPVNNPNPTPDDSSSSYLAINVSNPSGGTRAATDGGYEIGKTDDKVDENAVSSARFIILKKGSTDSDYKVAYSVLKGQSELNLTAPGNYPNTVERIMTPTIIIPNSVTGNSGAAVDTIDNNLELLVLLNYDQDVVTGTTKTQLLETISNNVDKTGTKFTMSNSSYLNGTDVVTSTPLYYKNLLNTVDAAKANPIDVYVERVVARVDLDKADGFKPTNNDLFWNNNSGDKRYLRPVILGYAYYGDPSHTLLFKNIKTSEANWQASGANDATNFRSYWATMSSDNRITQNTFNYSTTVGTNTTELNSFDSKYLYENTYGTVSGIDKATKVVVLAELRECDANGVVKTGAKGFDMACVFGQFTTMDGAAVIVANTLKGEKYRIETLGTDNVVESRRAIKYTNSTATDNDLAWSGKSTIDNSAADAVNAYGAYTVGNGDGNRTYLVLKDLKSNERLVKEDGLDDKLNPKYTPLTTEEITELKRKLQDDYAISYWKDGKCYFYTDVQHMSYDSNPNPGVVRNHVYKITFNGISGFGTPVFDPEKVIIPTPPTWNEDGRLVYLAAQVNILKWKVVNQSLVLGE